VFHRVICDVQKSYNSSQTKTSTFTYLVTNYLEFRSVFPFSKIGGKGGISSEQRHSNSRQGRYCTLSPCLREREKDEVDTGDYIETRHLSTKRPHT